MASMELEALSTSILTLSNLPVWPAVCLVTRTQSRSCSYQGIFPGGVPGSVPVREECLAAGFGLSWPVGRVGTYGLRMRAEGGSGSWRPRNSLKQVKMHALMI